MAFSLYGFIKGLLLQDESDRTKELAITIDPSATTSTRTTVVAAQTANRTITLPDSSGTLSTPSSVETLTNKTIDADLNTITNIDNNEIKAAAAIDASKIANGSVSNAEYQRLDGVTSSIQTQLDNNVNATAVVQANLDNHINDPTDAHDSSAISVIPSGNQTQTNVQSAINLLQTEIDNGISGANQSLSNLTNPTAINQNLTLNTSPNSIVETKDQSLTASSNLFLRSGSTSSFSSGNIFVTSGATGSGSSGDTNLSTGDSSSGISGSIILNIGTGSPRGKIQLTDGSEGTTGHVWTSTDTLGNGNWAVSAGSSGANTTLSNLTSPTAINQNLIPSGTRDLGSVANPFSALHLSASLTAESTSTFIIKSADNNSVGTADMDLFTGNSTGHASGYARLESGTSTIVSGNAIIATGSSSGGQTGDVQAFSGDVSGGSTSSGRVLVSTGSNSGSNSSGLISLITGPSVATTGVVNVTTGNSSGSTSGGIAVTTGNATSANHNSGDITLSTGTVSGTGVQGNIILNSNITKNKFIIEAISNITPSTTENALAITGPVHTFTPSGSTTLNGIAAGIIGQRLTLINNSGTNVTFVNLSGTPPSANRINTCTGANISTGGATASVVDLLYVAPGAWLVTSFNL